MIMDMVPNKGPGALKGPGPFWVSGALDGI